MKKIVFRNQLIPIEIFCKEKYKNYHIRGQVLELSDKVHFEDNNYGCAFYHLIIFVLVNNKYQKRIINESKYWADNSPIFTFFVGKTKKEFLDIQNAHILNEAKTFIKRLKNPLG